MMLTLRCAIIKNKLSFFIGLIEGYISSCNIVNINIFPVLTGDDTCFFDAEVVNAILIDNIAVGSFYLFEGIHSNRMFFVRIKRLIKNIVFGRINSYRDLAVCA